MGACEVAQAQASNEDQAGRAGPPPTAAHHQAANFHPDKVATASPCGQMPKAEVTLQKAAAPSRSAASMRPPPPVFKRSEAGF